MTKGLVGEPEEQVDRSGRSERKGVLAEGTAWAKPERTVVGCAWSVY